LVNVKKILLKVIAIATTNITFKVSLVKLMFLRFITKIYSFLLKLKIGPPLDNSLRLLINNPCINITNIEMQ